MKSIMKLNSVLLVLILLLVSSCANKDDNQTLSQALGAAAGGIIGAQFGAGTGKLLLTSTRSRILEYSNTLTPKLPSAVLYRRTGYILHVAS